MQPNQAQVASAVRTLVVALGSALGGWAIAKGWITQAELDTLASNPQLLDSATTVILALLGAAASAGAGVWGVVAHKQANMVAAVAAMPEVAEVKTVPTPAGAALAAAATAVAPVAVPVSVTVKGY